MGLETIDSLPGQTVLNYRIEGILGRGGMGVVVKAKDTKLHRPVALKFLSNQFSFNQDAIQQFQKEAIVASNINHPGICTIFTTECVDSKFFIVMEFLKGETLNQILEKNGPLPEHIVLDIVYQICSALGAAHTAGVIHRDIKPDNIMLCSGNQNIKIMDFGVAKLAHELSENISLCVPFSESEHTEQSNQFYPCQLSVTYSGFMGTSSYMSPEQCLDHLIDQRSDIFSLGVLIYELLIGKKPFTGTSHVKIMQNIVENDPIPINKIKTDLKYNWNSVIAKALQKDISNRYQTIEELVQALDSIHKENKHKRRETKTDHLKRIKWIKSSISFSIFITGIFLIISLFIMQYRFPDYLESVNSSIDKTQYYIQGKDWQSAESFAMQAVSQAEQSHNSKIKSDAYSIMGKLKHQQGQNDQAIKFLKMALTANPQHVTAAIRLAEIYALTGEIDKAEMTLQNILKVPLDLSNRALLYTRMGEILVYSGKFVEGLSNFDNAINLSLESKNFSNIYDLVVQTSEILLEFNQPLLAEKKRVEIKNKLKETGYTDDTLYHLIDFTIPLKIKIEQNRWQEAEKLLGLFKNTDDENIFNYNEIYFLLKRGYSKDQQIINEKFLKESQSTEDIPVILKYKMANYHAEQGKFDQAVEFCKDILQTNKLFVNSMPLYYNKALVLLSEIHEKLGNLEYSQELCGKFLKTWKNADPELEILKEIQIRNKRLQTENRSVLVRKRIQ